MKRYSTTVTDKQTGQSRTTIADVKAPEASHAEQEMEQVAEFTRNRIAVLSAISQTFFRLTITSQELTDYNGK